MEFVKDAISWLEIPVSDFSRAKSFYQTIFDFEMPVMDFGPIQMGFLLFDRDHNGIGGAICAGPGYKPAGADGPKVYLNGGEDLSTVLSRVSGAGGSIVLPKTEIGPDLGFMAFFTDSESNVIGLHSMG